MYCSLISKTNNAHYICEKNDIHDVFHDHNYTKAKKLPFDVVSYNNLCFDPCSDRVNYNDLLPNCVYFSVDGAIKCSNITNNYNYHLFNGELLTFCNNSDTIKPNKLLIDDIPQNNLHFDANSISTNYHSVNSNDVYFDACENTEHSVIHSYLSPTNVHFNSSDVNENPNQSAKDNSLKSPHCTYVYSHDVSNKTEHSVSYNNLNNISLCVYSNSDDTNQGVNSNQNNLDLNSYTNNDDNGYENVEDNSDNDINANDDNMETSNDDDDNNNDNYNSDNTNVYLLS